MRLVQTNPTRLTFARRMQNAEERIARLERLLHVTLFLAVFAAVIAVGLWVRKA